MTTKDKATELGIKYQTPCHGIGDCEFEARQSALEMAEWKEQQMIEKACEWLKDNIHNYYMTNEFEQWFDDMFEDLKEAMKGGEE